MIFDVGIGEDRRVAWGRIFFFIASLPHFLGGVCCLYLFKEILKEVMK